MARLDDVILASSFRKTTDVERKRADCEDCRQGSRRSPWAARSLGFDRRYSFGHDRNGRRIFWYAKAVRKMRLISSVMIGSAKVRFEQCRKALPSH